jgi:(S)-ureidoglycine aminohydrolase
MGNEKILIPGDIASKSRSILKPDIYMVLPSNDRVFSKLSQFNDKVQAKILAAPNLRAKFIEDELFINSNGGTERSIQEDFEHFFYVLEGMVHFNVEKKDHKLDKGSFVWVPPMVPFSLINREEPVCRMLWIRRKYKLVERWEMPKLIVSHESKVKAIPVDTYFEKHLTPYYDNPAFDMGINLQIFAPGTYFDFVESHMMEHGLYMLSGRGIYCLNKEFIEIQKDDFIYMAPFCPQSFYALGWDESSYLLYKDVNRDFTDELN